MGTDIHIFIQIFNGKWLLLKKIYDKANPSGYNIDILEDIEFNCICDEYNEYCECNDLLYEKIDFDGDRDYDSFGAIASIRGRNGRTPKGLPELDDKFYQYIRDYHSHTYFDEDELKEMEDITTVCNMLNYLNKVKTRYDYPVRFILCFDS